MTLLLICGHFANSLIDLAYHRDSIDAGDYFLLVTGQFVHANSAHLLLNTAALWLLWLGFGHALKTSAWFLASVTSLILVAMGLYFLSPEVVHYVGFSGALHGLFVTAALASISVNALVSTGVLALVALKLALELYSNDMTQIAAFIDSPIIHLAHLYGAIAGIICWLVILTLTLIPKRSSRFRSR